MAENGEVEKSLLEKIQDLLERKPGHYDVKFCVGKEKKIVRALKVILKASSPFLEKEFEEKWELETEEGGIPLPDCDPVAFELFVELTSQDTWSLETLKSLDLPPNQILNLLSICRRFEMKKAVERLEQLSTKFKQSFGKKKDTDDFLQLSQANLKSVLTSDDIEIKELDVFHCAIRWADFQCKEKKIQPTEEHIREALGDCLFEIRFPIMSFAEFTETTESNDILTAEETIGIYKFIGLTACKKLEFDAKLLPFKTMPRKYLQILPRISSLCLTQNLPIVDNPPFVCDDSENNIFIACGQKIDVHGLGFLGPIENDGFYDIKVQIHGDGIKYSSEKLEKRVFAQKGKTFYFLFDAPITMEAGSLTEWDTSYTVDYFLKGANTSTIIRPDHAMSTIEKDDHKFRLQFETNQIAEVLFKLV